MFLQPKSMTRSTSKSMLFWLRHILVDTLRTCLFITVYCPYRAGTPCGHFDEVIFGDELMTGYVSYYVSVVLRHDGRNIALVPYLG